ncbi:alpha/beta fold hydrolase [Variovorax atrisoli]|uniref:alpha/beta hydrolase n=1 Tax=Variovorax atrisoli TaxID=3394203 RepID=UPI000F7D7320|nr:alpha/beta hydrolase [Variovorax sp. 369]RTD90049.1 alpha/beta fold hydrolase [Variovorax sp. 369]
MRRWLLLALATLALGVLAVGGAGELLSRPVRPAVGLPPADLQAETVRIDYSGIEQVLGWQVRGRPGAGAILLLHGVRSDRRQMTQRARFLHRLGYSVLWIDLPAHGESSGDRITFGARESLGVKAALGYLEREMPNAPIGVIGVSLGAASTVLAGQDPRVRAVVLESMYSTIDDAVANRLKHYLGPLGTSLAPLLLWQLPMRSGIDTAQLRPVAQVGALHAPVFVISGSRDWHTTPAETQQVFEAAGHPRELWIVEGAAHVDLHKFARVTYEDRVGSFLAQYLRPH